MAAERALHRPATTSPRAVKVPRDTTHDATLEWIENNPDALTGFEEGWIAVVPGRVVAHSPSAVEVARMAREAGVENPLLIPVMAEEFIGA